MRAAIPTEIENISVHVALLEQRQAGHAVDGSQVKIGLAVMSSHERELANSLSDWGDWHQLTTPRSSDLLRPISSRRDWRNSKRPRWSR